MDTLFKGLLVIVFFTCFGYPLLILLLSIVFGKKAKVDEENLPSVSLIIVADNKESFIEKKILNSLEIDYPREKIEIVVISDSSKDQIESIVERYKFRGVQLYHGEGRVGKSPARNQAVLASRKEIIVFSDAVSVFKPDAIKKLVRNFSDKSVGMVCGNLRHQGEVSDVMGNLEKLFRAYESLIRRAQSRLGILTGSVGCINAFRRHLYHVLPFNIKEDFTQPLMILSQNQRVLYEADALAYLASSRKPDQKFEMQVREIRGEIKGLIFSLRHLNHCKQQWIIVQLFFHKVVRWLFFLILFQLFIVNIYCFLVLDNSMFDLVMIIQFVFYFLGIVGLFSKVSGIIGKIIFFPTVFLVHNAASAKALYLTLTSEIEATWETNIY